MKRIVISTIVTAAVVFGLMYFGVMRPSNDQFERRILESEEKISSVRDELIGYTKFTDYLTTGKQSISEQAKFIAASVVREYVLSQHIQYDAKIFTSSGLASVRYSVEYSFGYDLSPGKFDVVATSKGLEVRVDKPSLVASPAVKPISYEFPSKGLFSDEETATIEIMKRLPREAEKLAKALARTPEVEALCEKKLAEFLRRFLESQPGVKFVPAITIVHRS